MSLELGRRARVLRRRDCSVGVGVGSVVVGFGEGVRTLGTWVGSGFVGCVAGGTLGTERSDGLGA